jgi:N-acetylglutamate synthase-like GNAT family acetyltransferase
MEGTAKGAPGIRKTDDFGAVRDLALKSGLEDGTFENVAAAYGYYLGDKLVGCIALKIEAERYSVEWLAVSEQLRGMGIGAMLVSRVESEARMMGANRLWALARAPRFFENVGFRKSSIQEAGGPSMSNCMLCKQYQRDCFPAVVVKIF